ncbi:MAG: phage head closure protein [Hyphomicrobiaceae bacterium]
MPRQRAGDRYEHVAFDAREAGSDGHGGVTSTWVEQFRRRAAFIHLRGGEAVLAARLEGRHQVVIGVLSSADVRRVTTDWRVRDLRRGTVYNIRDITPSADRHVIDFLCESGVAP